MRNNVMQMDIRGDYVLEKIHRR